MSGSMRFGVFLAVFLAGAWLVGFPIASIAFILLAMFGATSTVTIWRRTRLPYATTAGAVATIGAVAAAYAVYGFSQFTLSWGLFVFFAAALAAPFLLYAESRIHPLKWQMWTNHIADKSALDILRQRHIPDLRQ